jgi:hypothetical protein
MKVRLNSVAAAALCGVALLGWSSAVLAESAGMVKTARGTANIERSGQKIPVTVGALVESGDRIVTAADGAVGITLRDNTLLSAGPNATLDLKKFAFNSTTHAGVIDASVKRGTLSVISGKIAKANPDGMVVSTPSATLGVRGTEFMVDAGTGQE